MNLALDDRLIVALDTPTADAARAMIERVGDPVSFYKIGLTLAAGGDGLALARDLKRSGKKVFLDLKFYDIPAQVEGAVAACVAHGYDLLTVHARPKIMAAAGKAAQGSSTKVLGVTVLTAFGQDDVDASGSGLKVADLVLKRVDQAVEAGIHGVVSSPLEASAIRRWAPEGFEIVTPGVRPAGAPQGDQKRVATPAEALRAGASRLVVGRPITAADDPRAAAAAILDDMAGA